VLDLWQRADGYRRKHMQNTGPHHRLVCSNSIQSRLKLQFTARRPAQPQRRSSRPWSYYLSLTGARWYRNEVRWYGVTPAPKLRPFRPARSPVAHLDNISLHEKVIHAQRRAGRPTRRGGRRHVSLPRQAPISRRPYRPTRRRPAPPRRVGPPAAAAVGAVTARAYQLLVESLRLRRGRPSQHMRTATQE